MSDIYIYICYLCLLTIEYLINDRIFNMCLCFIFNECIVKQLSADELSWVNNILVKKKIDKFHPHTLLVI